VCVCVCECVCVIAHCEGARQPTFDWMICSKKRVKGQNKRGCRRQRGFPDPCTARLVVNMTEKEAPRSSIDTTRTLGVQIGTPTHSHTQLTHKGIVAIAVSTGVLSLEVYDCQSPLSVGCTCLWCIVPFRLSLYPFLHSSVSPSSS